MAKITKAELSKKWLALPSAVQREARIALKKNADEFVQLAKNTAPVDDGGIRAGIKAIDTSSGGDASRILVKSDSFYTSFNEFGTERQNEQPFFHPAYRLMRKRFKSRISKAIRKGMKEAIGG